MARTDIINLLDKGNIAKDLAQSEKPVENIPVFAKEFVPLHP